MKYLIDQDEFVLMSDAVILPEHQKATLRFSLDSDLVKTIIETGLANVPLGDLVRKDIEEQFSRRLQGIVLAKEQLYEKAALIFEERQGDATEKPCPECQTGTLVEVGPVVDSSPLSTLFRCTSCDAGLCIGSGI